MGIGCIGFELSARQIWVSGNLIDVVHHWYGSPLYFIYFYCDLMCFIWVDNMLLKFFVISYIYLVDGACCLLILLPYIVCNILIQCFIYVVLFNFLNLVIACYFLVCVSFIYFSLPPLKIVCLLFSLSYCYPLLFILLHPVWSSSCLILI